jgi:hypothetical protein
MLDHGTGCAVGSGATELVEIRREFQNLSGAPDTTADMERVNRGIGSQHYSGITVPPASTGSPPRLAVGRPSVSVTSPASALAIPRSESLPPSSALTDRSAHRELFAVPGVSAQARPSAVGMNTPAVARPMQTRGFHVWSHHINSAELAC